LAQVSQALRQPHHEQVVGVLGVVHSQLSQHGRQPRVVCDSLTGSDDAHGHDGVVSHLGVAVVRELGQRVQDAQLRVRHRDQRQGQGHGTPDRQLSVAQQVGERPERHLAADLLAHGNQADPQHRNTSQTLLCGQIWALWFLLLLLLVVLVLLLVLVLLALVVVGVLSGRVVLGADVQQVLDLEHVARPSVGGHVHQHGGHRPQRLGDHLQRHQGGFNCVLLAWGREREREASVGFLELRLRSLHHGLQDGGGYLPITRPHGDQTAREGRVTDNL
ncbi:hypothetical protein EGW08_015542, partial [Elysia chlorotica]